MKKYVVLACLLASQVFAGGVSVITCETEEMTTQNTFTVVGMVAYDDSSWSTVGEVVVTLRKRGQDSVTELEIVKLEGTTKIYPAGSMGKDEIISLSVADKEGVVKRANLLGNHPRPLSSQLTFEDGLTFKSKCELQ